MKEIIATYYSGLQIFVLLLLGGSLYAQSPQDTIHTPKQAFPEDVIEVPVPRDDNAVMTDTGFIIRNIIDNLTEIQLAEFAKKKSKNIQVQKVATILIEDHKNILNAYKALANRKKGGLSAGQLENTATLPDLKPLPIAKGSDFNATWSSHMYGMHQSKIHELEQYIAVTLDPAVKAVAQKSLAIIKTHKNLLSKLPGVQPGAGDHEVIH